MNIQISGEGRTTLLFIHGYCEDLHIWDEFVDALKHDYQLVTIDLPGHGLSPLPGLDFSIDDVANDIHQILLSRDITEYFVIGHSLGGYVALSLAERFPDNVTGFGLFSSTVYGDDEEKKKARDKVKGFLEEHGVEKFIDSFVPSLFTPENRKKFATEVEQLSLVGRKMKAESIHRYAQAMKNRPDRSHLMDTDKPVFVIAGDRDMAIRLETSNKIIERIKNGDALILSDTGHQGFIEARKESIEFIHKFLHKHLQ